MLIRSHKKEISIEEPLDVSYADDIARLANDPSIKRSIGAHSFPYPYTKEDALFFIDSVRSYGNEVFKVDFLIKYNGRPAGIIGLSDINMYDRKAHVGYWIGKEFRNHGIATEALRTVIEYCKNMGLKRIYTSVLDFNYPSMIVLLKNGFRIEGTEYSSYRLGKRYYSFIKFYKLIR
ncbi:MAG: GNAT family N-acetyltransferase [Thermoplasmata archaeon]